MSLHLEGLDHELDKTGIGISTDRHQESNSDVQTGQQIINVQQFLMKLFLNCSLIQQRILAKPNNTQMSTVSSINK